MFVHPTDATGTKVGFEGELASIEASFDFHLLKTRELSRPPHVSPFWAPPHLEGGAPWQASVAVCLDAPGTKTSQVAGFGLSIENPTNWRQTL